MNQDIIDCEFTVIRQNSVSPFIVFAWMMLNLSIISFALGYVSAI